MEELGLPYEIIWHKRGVDGLAPASYLALHPAATAPVVQDGDRTLCESAAILEYVCHKYAGGRLTTSPDQPNFYDYVYWMHFNNNILGLFFTRLALGGRTEGRIAGFVHRRESGYARMLDQTERYMKLGLIVEYEIGQKGDRGGRQAAANEIGHAHIDGCRLAPHCVGHDFL